MKTAQFVLLVIAGAIVTTGVILTVLYRADMREAYRRLDIPGLKTATVSAGTISFVDEGEGEVVLALHGISGGYDQGISSARDVFGSGYRIIAPSRFGYPGSDLPENPDPEAQVEALVELLDGLGIEKVTLAGFSAGGTPVFSFLKLYPERVKAAVLVSPGVPVPDYSMVSGGPPPAIYRDWVFWAVTRFFPGALRGLFGVPEDLYRSATPEKRQSVIRMVRGVLPASMRKAGYLNDTNVTNPFLSVRYDEYRLEDIKTPVMFVLAEDDPMSRYEFTKAAADRVPGARILSYPKGGHLMFGCNSMPDVRAFLAEHGVRPSVRPRGGDGQPPNRSMSRTRSGPSTL